MRKAWHILNALWQWSPTFLWASLVAQLIKNPPAMRETWVLENSAVATGLEKISFHSNPKERRWQRMLKLYIQ